MRIFERYLSDISREHLLEAEEEADLARRCRAGDAAARRRLVAANLRFVVSLARRYRGRGLPLDDLVNEGNLGLVRAADRFDPERGVRFISYAHFWIRRAMTQAIARDEERPSRGGPPRRRISLDEPVPGGAWALAEVLADETIVGTEVLLEREGLRAALEASFVDLPERERLVLRGYFGFGCDRPRSLGEISREIGVSRERVRQLKERGLARLRAAVVRHGLDGYADGFERPQPGGFRAPGPTLTRCGNRD